MHNRRRRLTVPKEFRNRFIIAPLLIILIGFNLLILINIFFTNNSWLAIFKPKTIFFLAIVEFILGFWIVLSGILAAHRTAGPMVALQRGLKKIGAGDLTATVKFRKYDLNQNIAHSFNENIEKLRKQVVMIKQFTEKLNQELPDDDTHREVLEKLKQELDYLQT